MILIKPSWTTRNSIFPSSTDRLGWQSWSHTRPGFLKFPHRNFSPHARHQSLPKTSKYPAKRPATGWCSWYGLGHKINEKVIFETSCLIAKNKSLKALKYILIDDGWATWGDWTTPHSDKFPNGLKSLAARISGLGLKPGIWLAPFLVNHQSYLARIHPDWLVRDSRGKPVEGTKYSSLDRFLPTRRYILDLRLIQARNYIQTAIRTLIKDWGFKLLKLDFLYANHFNPAFSTHHTPDRILKNFLKTIKDKYPGVYTIACGCPLAPAVGVVDAMRISDDIVYPPLKGVPFINSLVHTRQLNQLETNLKNRLSLRNLWHLDPDVFVCHPSYGLSKPKINKLFSLIQKSRGVIFLGDDLISLPKSLFRSYITPLLKTRSQVDTTPALH